MIKHALVIFFILTSINFCFGQGLFYPPFGPCSPKHIIKKGKNAGLLGYTYNGKNWAEIGFVRGYRSNYDHQSPMIASEIIYSYLSVSSDFFIGNQLIICPKISYHYVCAIIDIGINIFNYTDFSENKFGFRPEIGLSLTGLTSVNYGYNIATDNDSFNISKHNLSIRIIMKSKLFYKFHPTKGND